MTPATTPYGSWKSPITADLIVADSVSLGQIELDGDDIYWVEMRPQEGARNVVVGVLSPPPLWGPRRARRERVGWVDV
mgnify:CR=1 FL=1